MFDPHLTSNDAETHTPNEQCILVGKSTCIAVLDASDVPDFVKLFKPSRVIPLSELTLNEILALPASSPTRDALLIGYMAAVKHHENGLNS